MVNAWATAFQRVFTPQILKFLGTGLLNTLYIAAVSIAFSLIIGTVLGLVRQMKPPVFGRACAIYVEAVRNIPLTLFIIAVRFMTPLPPLESGICAMTVFTSAIVAEIVRGGLNSVAPGQWEAAHSQGFSKLKALWHVIVPQALRSIKSPLIAQFVTTVKDTSFCAVVGTYELSFTSKIIASHRTIKTAEDIMVIYFLTALLYYLLNVTFSTLARRSKENASKGLVR